ncbi:23S rRNA (adenine(2058)-N(6))-methyltransferase Erm(O) [Actinoplanes sp. OR16]|uniref:ErmE/ErmH/ErmO/ErmR family 23S rRNA (adenine(2058)-N(6))-methyltransferase n=1 Tax=Actinoplanes sp. OR16 TaxID=946334 RepID=UPI000F7007DA|nr:ErmE/ErmH/ErmO/ErmR family 23S rRNA (adenine(2058)-N(6))-methyltransferase [Actinoplanes sp. OR16]BBH70543.1 23S rRNA (adenine(2058)-N(6))-methyltransferase Erm(O) [Actinoplanes sp. OR16]
MAPQPLRREHARARRAYGQNFLADPATARRLADLATIDPDIPAYEVGAGRGRLTTELLRRSRRVIAYEIDPALVATLPAHPRLTVRTDDFLAATPPAEDFTVAGNIPYGLTSPVIDWCLRAPALRRATLLTQWEYARKRTGDYGRWTRLTILTWPDFTWSLAARVPAAAFRPVPRVDGGVLVLDRRPAPLIPPERRHRYRRLVERGFTGVGGSLHATLSRDHGRRRTSAAFRACRLTPDRPVGEVWPEQWLTLFRLLT